MASVSTASEVVENVIQGVACQVGLGRIAIDEVTHAVSRALSATSTLSVCWMKPGAKGETLILAITGTLLFQICVYVG